MPWLACLKSGPRSPSQGPLAAVEEGEEVSH